MGLFSKRETTDALLAGMFACLERGGTVIAANPRAARWLRLEHAARQRRSGLNAWQTPHIHDWNSWLGLLWGEHLVNSSHAPMLLTSMQERAIWQRVTEQHGDAKYVVSPRSLAELAENAFALLSAYEKHGERNRSWNFGGHATPSDVEAFRRWAGTFDEECRRKGWMSRSLLPTLLVDSIKSKLAKTPREVVLVGFDRPTPAQSTLLRGLKDAGFSVAHAVIESGDSRKLRRVEAKDCYEEILACAWWSRRVLEANPAARIGVIVQDGQGLRGEIERTFRRVLLPESQGIEWDGSMPFEFSLGVPLSTIPVIKGALLFLRWLASPLTHAEISWLITSGFFGSGVPTLSERGVKPRVSGMRSQQSLQDFLSGCQSAERSLLTGLDAALRMAVKARIPDRSQTFASWIQLSARMLPDSGWPGTPFVDSTAFQAVHAWQRLLDNVAMLDFEGGRVIYDTFVTMLEHNAAETIFAAESEDAPVQIMGALESAGQQFDALWFMGVDDQQWPSRGQPHPLLPRWLQRDAGMPHSSTQVDWQLAHSATQRIAASASECVFSYAKQDACGALRPSPLLSQVFDDASGTLSAADFQRELGVSLQPRRGPQTNWIEDWSAVTWIPGISAGGADILKMQAACPFQAFATRRLGARESDDPEHGLTARDRGDILHSVLDGLWSADTAGEKRLHTRDELRNAKVTGSLDEIIDHHISRVFQARGLSRLGDAWSQAYLQVEQERLKSLLSRWLAWEEKREPFAVEACERPVNDVRIGDLTLQLRVDRVDRLDGGGALLIDYKTGEVSSARWKGPRLDDPQLPLYGSFGGVKDLRGILFAQIRAGGQMKFDGCVEDPEAAFGTEFGVKQVLTEDMRDSWENALRALADEFLHGHATVSPKLRPATCKYCALPGLCRVAETAIFVEPEEAEHSGEEAAAHD